MRQKYLDAVAYLLANPRAIVKAWVSPSVHLYGCLFQFVTPDGRDYHNGKICGCLTQIAFQPHTFVACTEELTKEIRADQRLNIDMDSRIDNRINGVPILSESELMAFAEWQDRLDDEIRANTQPTV